MFCDTSFYSNAKVNTTAFSFNCQFIKRVTLFVDNDGLYGSQSVYCGVFSDIYTRDNWDSGVHILDDISIDMIVHNTFENPIPSSVLKNTYKWGCMEIFQIAETGKYVYTINGICYHEQFPIRWAMFPFQSVIDKYGIIAIHGPGLTKHHCYTCNYAGSFRGVFVGYCDVCSKMVYDGERGKGYINADDEYIIRNTIDETRLAYLNMMEGCRNAKGHIANYLFDELVARELCSYHWDVIDHPETDGYDHAAVCCLEGGPLPTTPDVCDSTTSNPENMDEIDIPLQNTQHLRISKRFPRRAYGFPRIFPLKHQVIYSPQHSEFTEEEIAKQIELFFRFNASLIEVLNDNYSFPLPIRPEWDAYRRCFKPRAWRAWDIKIKNVENPAENVKIHVFMYISNVYQPEVPSEIAIEFNNIRGCRSLFWDVFNAFKSWFHHPEKSAIIKVRSLYGPVFLDI